jgi:5-methylthioadenosine/S-adenosylhomocysteine deaminase
MTLLRGLADDLRLDVWLMGYIMPVEREFVNPEFVILGTKLGCAEMIRSGITTFCDMYYYEEDIARATVEAGMRAVLAETILKFPAPDAPSYEDSLAYCREYIQRWKGHPLIVPGVAPHAHYTCPPEILKACVALALEFDVPLHTHVSETALEVENSRAEHDMPVVPWIKKQGVLDTKLIAAHCVHIDEGEMRSLLQAGAGVSHNPTSNLKLASGVASVQRMLEIGLNVGIGTDGPASNNDLDMFEETRLAALVAKGFSGNPTAVPAKDAFAMATCIGARALHLGHLTGSLEVGKRADLVVVELDLAHNTPRFHRDPDAIYSQLVYTSKSSDVRHVLCNGQWLLREGELQTLDEASLRQQAQELAGKIDQFLEAREGDVLSKLLAIGGLAQEGSFEVQVKAQLDDVSNVLAFVGDADNVKITKSSRYRQYDTYFSFADKESGQVRIREDVYLDNQDQPTTRTRTRLTLIGPAHEREFTHSIVLNRSRFTARGNQSVRFYREYFQPFTIREITKLRYRYRVLYQETDFAINIDRILEPAQPGYFVEIKSHTWSQGDAEKKVELIGNLLHHLGIDDSKLLKQEYHALLTP